MSQTSDRLISLPRLLVSREEAAQKIREQIEVGKRIRNRTIGSREALNKAYLDRDKWSDFYFELLRRYFDDDSVAGGSMPRSVPIRGLMSFERDVEAFREYTNVGIARLESILARLPLIPEPEERMLTVENVALSNRIFVVHGHDDAVKESVARFIEKLDLRPIILHEQPNAGRTIIEKFEDFSNVGFAVVLLTPDDIGGSRETPNDLKPHARQNVILELGYFMGKLGRGKVCALYKEDVDIPSDYQGVLYIPLDSAGAWRMKLAKEIKNAGIEIDLNKAL